MASITWPAPKVLLTKEEYHRLKLMVEGLEPEYN
jgi:hypothetical protein